MHIEFTQTYVKGWVNKPKHISMVRKYTRQIKLCFIFVIWIEYHPLKSTGKPLVSLASGNGMHETVLQLHPLHNKPFTQVNLHFMKFSSRWGCEQVLQIHTCELSPDIKFPMACVQNTLPMPSYLPFNLSCTLTYHHKQTVTTAVCCRTACKQRCNGRCIYL